MKRLTVLLLLVLILSLSLLGVTLAIYVKEVKLYDEGWVGPRYFAFTAEGSGQQKSLQPGGSVSFDFTVSNFDGDGIAQVPLHTTIAITIPNSLAGTGTLKGELRSGTTLLAASFAGSIECNGNTLAAGEKDSDTYTLTITWQGADLQMLGGKTTTPFDPSQIAVRVSAYQ